LANVRLWLDREIINRHWWQLASVRFARLACGVSIQTSRFRPGGFDLNHTGSR
jgi:hypothetical protein